MKPVLAVLALALLVSFPPVQAQVPEPGDVDLSELRVEREPTTQVAVVVSAVVYNNGTQPTYATVQFSYGDGSPLMGAAGVDDTNGRLLQGNTKTIINLTWVPEEDRKGPQAIRAVLRSQSDVNTVNNEKGLQTFVRAPAVNVTVESPLRLNLSAGSTGFLRYTVRNDGNAPDTFLVEGLGNATWKPRVLGDGNLTILPGQSRTGDVAYTAPTDGDDYNLTLTVTASSTQRGNASASARVPVMLHSNRTMSPAPRVLSLAGVPPQAQILPGETLTYEATLRNLGTLEDVVLLNATFDANLTGWSANVTALPNATGFGALPDANGTLVLALSPGQSRAIRVNVTRLPNATTELANLTVLAVSNDSALLRAVQPGGEYRASLTARLLNASPEVALLGLRQPGAAYQGEDLTLGVTVANLGRLPAAPGMVQLELTDGTFALRQDVLRVPDLAPGQFVNLTWVTRSADLQGKYQVTGRLVPNATRGDRDLTDNQAATEVLVRRPDVDVRAPDSVDVVPGARLVLLGASTGISVTNGGPADEAIRVTLTSDAPWLAAEWTVDVPASGTVVLPLDVEVPRYPHVSLVNARVRAALVGRSDFGANASIVFRVDDRQGPDATILAPAGATLQGETVRILVRADDATGVADASAIVAVPGGERVLLTLQRVDNVTYAANFTPTRAGLHALEVRLGDATPARHTTILPNHTWVVQERPYRGFEAVNFREGGSTNLRVLKLKEADAGTTATVEVDAGDGYRPLAFPYEVRPAGWTEGAHVLRVRATSLGGQSWARAWNVTLDTTPPALSDLTVTTAGSLTTITVRADGAANVTARFAGGEGEHEARLNPAAGKAFSASLRPPAGWTRVTLLAQDAAGNVASLEHDTNQRPTPTAAAWSLVALAVAAIAFGRRRA